MHAKIYPEMHTHVEFKCTLYKFKSARVCKAFIETAASSRKVILSQNCPHLDAQAAV